MSFLNKVRDAIDTKFFCEAPNGNLRLVEEKNLANPAEDICREVHIQLGALKNDAIILKIDLEEPKLKLHPLLKAEVGIGINKRCDYIIICPYEDKIYIIVMELKSLNTSTWYRQCVVGESLVHYIMSAIDRNGGTHHRKSFEYRHVLFTTNGKEATKRPTGNNTVTYLANTYNDSYYVIHLCNNPINQPYHLASFLSGVRQAGRKK